MKKLLLTLSVFFCTEIILAQSPEKINYQAIARDLSGNPLTNTVVNLTFEILQGSASGTVTFTESQTKTTNQFGLFTAEIGAVNTTNFPNIAWGANSYYLRISVNGDVMPASQLLSVPYALYSKSSGGGTAGTDGVNCWDTNANGVNDAAEDINGDTFFNGLDCKGDSGVAGPAGTSGLGIQWLGTFASPPTTPSNNDAYYDTSLKQSLIWVGSWTVITKDGAAPTFIAGNGISFSGDTISATDGSITNEIQTLSINVTNDTIFLTNGGFIQLPSSANLWNTNPQGIAYSTGNVGIGTTLPQHKLSVVATDSIMASFSGNNANFSAISLSNANPSGATGFILLVGSDTAIFGFEPTEKMLVLENSTTGGHVAINADSTVTLSGISVATSSSDMIFNKTSRIYNETDTIFDFSTGGTIVHSNQGMFLTDSLSVLGNNSANPNWVLANDGMGQAKWTDPNTLGINGGAFISNGTETVLNNLGDKVGIGTAPGPNSRLSIRSSATLNYGINNQMDYTGTSTAYGIYNFSNQSGTGDKYGLMNDMNQPTGANTLSGIVNTINHGGSGSIFGVENHVLGTNGTGAQYGTRNLLQNTGTGFKQGTSNSVSSSSGANPIYGTRNDVTHDGTGAAFGISISLAGASTDKTGIWIKGEDKNFFSNRVGIGTQDPLQLLTLSSLTSTTLRMERTDAAAFDWEMNADNLGFHLKGGANGTAGALTDFVNVDGFGKMGLGITTPTQLLHLFKGTLRIDDGINPYNLPAAAGAAGDVLVMNGGNATWQTPPTLVPGWELSGNAISGGDVFGTTNAQDLHLQAGGATAVTINNDSQNVGVGTTTPTSKLVVNGAVAKAIKFCTKGESIVLDQTHSTIIFHPSASTDILDVELPNPSKCIGRIYHFTYVNPSIGAVLNINAPAGVLIYMTDSYGKPSETFPNFGADSVPVGCTLVANDTGWYAISNWVGDPALNAR
jgi:hypothetical protein